MITEMATISNKILLIVNTKIDLSHNIFIFVGC